MVSWHTLNSGKQTAHEAASSWNQACKQTVRSDESNWNGNYLLAEHKSKREHILTLRSQALEAKYFKAIQVSLRDVSVLHHLRFKTNRLPAHPPWPPIVASAQIHKATVTTSCISYYAKTAIFGTGTVAVVPSEERNMQPVCIGNENFWKLRISWHGF